MMILVANIGSTSFKFRLFDMDGGQRELAAGGIDRIGSQGGVLAYSIAGAEEAACPCPCAEHAEAISACLGELTARELLAGPDSLDAVAFKAITAGETDPVVLVDDAVLAAMERCVPIAPAHNPAYIAAMRSFREVLPAVPLVAALGVGLASSIRGRNPLTDGFGLIAFASMLPIIFVLLYGMVV
ncbi:hypothetical protein LCGC14_1971890 [marine sediment metagenome]|uniref:Butyrate kinase n=1 Tax=marine sediment metagenome TaxID=412755 RepID=A0A0F9FBI0_9ZZZZ